MKVRHVAWTRFQIINRGQELPVEEHGDSGLILRLHTAFTACTVKCHHFILLSKVFHLAWPQYSRFLPATHFMPTVAYENSILRNLQVSASNSDCVILYGWAIVLHFAGLLWNISHTFFVHLVTTLISITISVYPSNQILSMLLTPWIEQSGLVRITSDYHRGKSPSLSGTTYDHTPKSPSLSCITYDHTSEPQRSLELWMPTVDTKTRPSLVGQTYHSRPTEGTTMQTQFRLSIRL